MRDLGGSDLYEEMGEPLRVKRILWFAGAVLAGALLAVLLYLIS